MSQMQEVSDRRQVQKENSTRKKGNHCMKKSLGEDGNKNDEGSKIKRRKEGGKDGKGR